MMFSRFYILRANNIFLLIRCEEILDLTTNHGSERRKNCGFYAMRKRLIILHTQVGGCLLLGNVRHIHTYIHMDSSYLFGSWLIYGVAVHCACRLDEYVYGLQWHLLLYINEKTCLWVLVIAIEKRGNHLFYFVYGCEITELIIVGFL